MHTKIVMVLCVTRHEKIGLMCMLNLTTFLTLNLNNLLDKSSNLIKSPSFMHFVGNLTQFTKLECLRVKEIYVS